jgi:hypothetical protein
MFARLLEHVPHEPGLHGVTLEKEICRGGKGLLVDKLNP